MMNREEISFLVTDQTKEIVIVFSREGTILYTNRTAQEKLEYTEEELFKLNMAELFRQEFQREGGIYFPFNKSKLTLK